MKRVAKCINKPAVTTLVVIFIGIGIALYTNAVAKNGNSRENFATADEEKYPDMKSVFNSLKIIQTEVTNINAIYTGSKIDEKVKTFLKKDSSFQTLVTGFSMGESSLKKVISNIQSKFPGE